MGRCRVGEGEHIRMYMHVGKGIKCLEENPHHFWRVAEHSQCLNSLHLFRRKEEKKENEGGRERRME